MNVGMVSTRFAGIDGVSLEAAKLAQVLRRAGHDVVWFAGELDQAHRPGMEYRPAHFLDEANLALQSALLEVESRSPEQSETLDERSEDLAGAVGRFITDHGVDCLFIHNAVSLPLNLPLGMALNRVLGATGIGAVCHHHDFWWERSQFRATAVQDILDVGFPPTGDGIDHVAIHSAAVEELARRRGVRATLLPNLMDFEAGPEAGNAAAFRLHAGLDEADRLILQPTRVVPRKGIETTLELVRRLGDPALKVAVTHESGDEGDAYPRRLRSLADRYGVDLRFAPVGRGGEPTLADAYAAADLVAYPSLLEGFGNALLEAFFYRRPVLVNRYPVYGRDIAPTGVRCIEIEGGRLDEESVDQARAWLHDPSLWKEVVEHNYRVGSDRFSYAVARERLLPLFGSAKA